MNILFGHLGSALRPRTRPGAASLVITLAIAAAAASAAPPPPSADASRIQLPSWPKPGLTLHVAPEGTDGATGSSDQPFGSLDQARDALRRLRHHGQIPDGGALILVHGGGYPVTRTFGLAAEDSGSKASPVRFQAAPGEQPVFRGGVRLTGWHPLSDTRAFPQLPHESRSKVWQLDLQALGITNLLPLKLGGFASGLGFTTHPAHELFFNGKPMQLARGPNEGFLHIADVAIKDGTKGYDRQGSKAGKFFYQGDRPSRWVDEPDLLLYGYWFWDWADSYERVATIDPKQRLITLAEPWSHYGFSTGAPFCAINALSELDAPGEWYLDRRHGQVLLYPPSDPAKATIELSLFAAPMVELDDVSHVSFEGLTWELGCADAIQVRGGAQCLFAGCTVRCFAGNGIGIRGGSGHGLLSCDIYSLGRGGTILSGGDRKTLAPGNHFIENCDIHELSRIDHTYTPAVILEGVGNRVAHNRFHDIPSSALRVGGNDHLLEYNEIFNVVTESDDQGGADMYGNPTYRGNVYRFNYWHHIGRWRPGAEPPKCGQAGIRLDDAICGTRIYGNIFERCSAGKTGFGGVQIHGGKDNVVEDNLFLDCAAAVSFTPWSENRWQQFVRTALDDKAIDRALYLQRYPELAQLAEHPNTNRVCHNLAVRCGPFLLRASASVEAFDNTAASQGQLTRAPDNPLLKRPGRPRIPIEQIGLYPDAWRQGDHRLPNESERQP